MLSSARERVPGITLLLLTMLLSIFPLVSMLSAALQPQGSVPAGIQWPSDPQWGNFVDAWKVADITPLIWSSLVLVAVVVPVTALVATMAGYALGQLRIPGGSALLRAPPARTDAPARGDDRARSTTRCATTGCSTTGSA